MLILRRPIWCPQGGLSPPISSLTRVAHRDIHSDIPQPVSDWRIVPPERVG